MDSSQHAMSQIVESVYGTTPDTPAFKLIRHKGTTLALAKGSMISEELRADRQISDMRHGNKQVGGEITGELSYGTYDEFMEACLGGTWAVKAAPYTASTISAAASDNSINDSANGLPLLTAGDKVTITGFTGTVENNAVKAVVVTSTAAKMVLTTSTPFVDDAAGEAVTVTTLTQKLSPGATRRSFSILRDFSDATEAGQNRYHLYVGQEIATFKLTIGVEALLQVAFSVIGKNQPAPSDDAPAGATFVAANTNAVLDSFTGTLYEGGAAIATVTELNFTLENGLAPKFVVFQDTMNRPSLGRSDLKGQITAYAENASLLKKFINQTESSLVFTLADGAGNKYRFTIPRIKYTGGQMDTAGQGPIMIPAPWQALLDSTSSTNLKIERIAA